MSNVVKLPTDEARLDEASRWVARIDRGLNDAEKSQFSAWLCAHKSNRDTFVKVVQVWDRMEILQQLSEMFPHQTRANNGKRIRRLAIAASFLIASFAALLMLPSVDRTADLVVQQVYSQQKYQTGVGEQRTVALPDGSTLQLNTDSAVDITFTDRQRLIELHRGEVHIDVAHDTARPLSVYAADSIIQAVGTAFNVELRDQQVELIVTEGKVLVADKGPEHQRPLTLQRVHLNTSSMAVSAGQAWLEHQTAREVTRINPQVLEANLSWQEGNLIFRGESLEKALSEVERYTDYRFHFADSQVRNMQIAGLFKTNDVEGLLAAMEQNLDVRHEVISEQIIVLSSKSLSDSPQS